MKCKKAIFAKLVGRSLEEPLVVEQQSRLSDQGYLKLHLPTSFVSTTLLTRGYFEVLFADDEGTILTRKIRAVEWSTLNLSFSKYVPNFDASIQGIEALLSHSINVQFPVLHEQFRNAKALTIMASKIEEVLEIKSTNLYMKRPACPMIIKSETSTSSPDTFASPPWRKGHPRRTLPHKEFYILASQINARNAVDLGISPELAQYLKPQFRKEVLPQATPHLGTKE